MVGTNDAETLDDYLEGAGYGAGVADKFTLGAPTAVFYFDDGNDVVDHDQSTATAHGDA